ncbi:hypothetical protein PVK06_020858 [Gossypium arboreum]|uniref:Uncharacterized protein n=1 Tax=Gossypium arboreum TaxID=29729 RepID=A0ABR0PNG6_GOSAR|nr:hypothetical protein PVK06_020858 [Gossypium arboreum]
MHTLIETAPRDKFFSIVEPTYLELTLEFCSIVFLLDMMSRHEELHTISFRLDGTTRYLSVLDFRAALGLYYEEFMSAKGLLTLYWHIHHSPSLCWIEFAASMTPYDPS